VTARLPTSLAVLGAAAALAAGCGSSEGTSPDGRGDGDKAQQIEPTTIEVPSRTLPVEPGDDSARVTDRDLGFDATEIFRRDGPGVVTILSIFQSGGDGGGLLGGGDDDEDDEEGGGQPQGGVGSGFVVNARGEIATNAHVVTTGEGKDIKKASEVYVKFADDNQVEAEIVGFDPNADVALLRLKTLQGLTLRPVELGSSKDVVVGAPVVAIGSPFGEEQSLSVGVVSATDRAIESLTGFSTLGAVQTDAAINQGNSGGPLINADGQVIGINAQIRTRSGGGEGVGYAIPVDQVRRSLDGIREDGTVEYAYLGVSSVPVYPQLAKKFGLGVDHGAWVQEVVKGQSGANAGLKAGTGQERFQDRPYRPGGDVITKINGTRIENENDLGIAVAKRKPGEQVTLEVFRDGTRQEITATLGERPQEVDGG